MVYETKINPTQFKKLSNIVYKESGVVLNEKKYCEYMIETLDNTKPLKIFMG